MGLPYDFEAGVDAIADQVDSNFNYLAALVESGVLADLISAGALTSTIHGDLKETLSDMHSATSVDLLDTAGLLDAVNVEAAIAELAEFTGIGVSGIIGQYLIEQARDDSNVFPANNPVAEVAVPADAAPYGIIVQIDAYIVHDATAAGNDLTIPLNITNAGSNPGDLSASGSRNERFELGFGADGPAHIAASRIMTYLKAGDGWEETIANTVKIGTPWTTGNMSATNHGIIVWGLKQ